MNVIQQQLVIPLNRSPMHNINCQASVHDKQERVVVAKPRLLNRVRMRLIYTRQKLHYQSQQVVQAYCNQCHHECLVYYCEVYVVLGVL